MAFNPHQSVPFWDFINSLEGHNQAHGEGINNPTPGHESEHFGPEAGNFGFGGPRGFGFGPGAFGFGPVPEGYGRGFGFGEHGRGRGGLGRGGFGGSRGRHCGARGRHCDPHHERADGESAPQDDKPRDGAEGATDHEGSGAEGSHHPNHYEHRRGPHHRGPRRGGLHEFGGAGAPFDLSALLGAFAQHPIAQALRTYAEQSGLGDDKHAGDDDNTFTPAVDIFSTPSAFVLHVALPGAKKEDVGVNWDAEKAELNIAGVVYRAGDEEFIKTLSKSERKVGVFERSIKLPPAEQEKEEVDGDAISAKLEDGVLVVTVPKVEKEWTEVKKVDIL